MGFKTEIKNAITSHARWKKKLKHAVDAGKIDTAIETIKADNACTFGTWLYGPTITEEQKNTPHYQAVKELHAAFHDSASRVAQFATAGNKTVALKMLDVDGEFTKASGQLSSAMLTWLVELDNKKKK